MILVTDIFPNKFKDSFIVPGQKNMINNYRPFAIINVFSKIFEKIIFCKLSAHLNK